MADLKYEDKIKIFSSLLKNENYNFAREAKIFKKLFNESPNWDFWLQIDIGFKLNSLAFFLTEKGKLILKEKYRIYHFKEPNIQKEKFEENNIVKSDISKNLTKNKKSLVSLFE